MKILENLLPGSQENEIESYKLFWFKDRSCNLIECNLETLKKTAHMLLIPENIDRNISMCSLPGNRLFCYGNREDNWTSLMMRKSFSSFSLTGLTFIVDENYNVNILPRGTPGIELLSIYYDNCVYIFGRNIIERFNLIKWKWEKLTKNPGYSKLSTCTSLSGMILASGNLYDDILVFDLLTLSISVYRMKFKLNSNKFLCSYKNCAYLFDFSGKVFQSEINSPFDWNIIVNWNLKDLIMTPGQRTFYKDCWYFLTNSTIYKFDFKKKEIEEVHTP